MKNFTYILLIGIIALLSSNDVIAQHAIKQKKAVAKNIVQQLNTPSKIWVNGYWTVKLDGSRTWKKGHWIFEERSFQEKSKILKSKSIQQQKT